MSIPSSIPIKKTYGIQRVYIVTSDDEIFGHRFHGGYVHADNASGKAAAEADAERLQKQNDKDREGVKNRSGKPISERKP